LRQEEIDDPVVPTGLGVGDPEGQPFVGQQPLHRYFADPAGGVSRVRPVDALQGVVVAVDAAARGRQVAFDATDAVTDDVYSAVSVAYPAVGAAAGDVRVYVVDRLLLVGRWGWRRRRCRPLLSHVLDRFVDVLVLLDAGVRVDRLVDDRLVVVADGALRVAVLVAVRVAAQQFLDRLINLTQLSTNIYFDLLTSIDSKHAPNLLIAAVSVGSKRSNFSQPKLTTQI
jgi:hypothetical protein